MAISSLLGSAIVPLRKSCRQVPSQFANMLIGSTKEVEEPALLASSAAKKIDLSYLTQKSVQFFC